MTTEQIIITTYILGALITHLIIYKDGEKGIDHNTANICCVAWPAALLIYSLLLIKKLIKRVLNNF